MAFLGVKAISFDVGGTLVHDPQGAATQEIADLFGVSLPEMRTHLGREAKRHRQRASQLARQLVAEFDRPELLARLVAVLARRRAAAARPVMVPNAEHVLRVLRAGGYRIVLLSNVLGAIAPRPAEPAFFALADAVFMSCDTGLVKPEPAAFRQVEEHLGLRPDQLVHVGDSPGADVSGALDAGWHAVLFDPTTPPDAPGDGAYRRWCRVPELRSLLEVLTPDR